MAGLVLAGITILMLPSHGNTSGWKDTYSPALPAPGGPYAVGVRRTRLVENGRPDPWRPDTERQLMVDVHYPAASPSRPMEQYYVSAAMTELGSLAWAPGEEERLGLEPREVNWQFRTHSHEWAPPVPGSYPVIVCSAPPGRLRSSYAGIAEELAGHGFVVVTVDYPYDAPVVELFPTRRVESSADAQVAVSRTAADKARTDDLAHVVATLGDLDPELTPILDQQHVGLLGWVGTRTADVARLAHLPKVSAVASLGAGPMDVTGAGDTPLLVVKALTTAIEGRATGWSATVSLSEVTERGLTDDGATLTQVARAYPRTNTQIRRAIGSADPSTTQPAIRRYVAAFFDLHLRGIPTDAFSAPPPTGVSVDPPDNPS